MSDRDASPKQNEPETGWAVDTRAAQALGRLDPVNGGIIPATDIATTYVVTPEAEPGARPYARPDNATARHVEQVLADLDGGADALVFGSGMAAAVGVFLSLDRPAHVIAPTILYWALRAWLDRDAASHGLDVSFVDQTDPEAVAAAVRPGETRLVWLETPANPTWDVADVARIAEIARTAGALLCVDSTCATPILSRPLALGADIVMHSATKYLNGHSDVLAGALIFVEPGEAFRRTAHIRKTHGAILGGRDAAELLRGLRTLPLRVRRQADSALTIALHFAGHPAVRDVLYPGLPWHEGHALARRQMPGGFGGMLSLRLAGGADAAARLVFETRLWKNATSLGGIESLIEHRAPVEGPDTPCPDDLLRLSVGIEDPGDLIADLEQALDRTNPL